MRHRLCVYGCMARTTRYSAVKQEFGERVRLYRKAIRDDNERKLSQERLGHRAGMDRTQIGKIERGETNLGLEGLVKLAAALDLDPGELVRGLKPSEDPDV